MLNIAPVRTQFLCAKIHVCGAVIAAGLAAGGACTHAMSNEDPARISSASSTAPVESAAAPSGAAEGASEYTPLALPDPTPGAPIVAFVVQISEMWRAMGKIEAACALWGSVNDTQPPEAPLDARDRYLQYCAAVMPERHAQGHAAMAGASKCTEDSAQAQYEACSERLNAACCQGLAVRAQYNRVVAGSRSDAPQVTRWYELELRLETFGCIAGSADSCAEAARSTATDAKRPDPEANAFFRRHACRLGHPPSCQVVTMAGGAGTELVRVR